MKKGLILAGEPMGLLIAQSEGDLSGVSGYDLAVAGAEFNVAIGAARLGHRVTYLTKLGKDPFGERIIHVLNENGIGNEFVSWSDEKRTGFMLKGRVHAGDPPIFYLRPQLWPDEHIMRKTINDLAARADIVLPGTAEGKILMGSDDPAAICAFYQELGAKTVITKCGAAGAYVADGAEHYKVTGFRVREVVDTVGAGDGFAAGILTGLMEGLPMRDAVRRAAAIGAIQVMSRGDNEGLPTPAELERFMKEADSTDE